MNQAVTRIEPTEVAAQSNAPMTPMDMLASAVSRGETELAEKLMDLADRWGATQARKAFDAAISEAKAKIPVVQANATGNNNKAYADFAAFARAIDPVLSAHGLSYRFRATQADRISVTCVLSHRDGHSEETTLSGPADQTGNKNAIQAIGSTLTYLQRYSLRLALGLASSADDDGKAAGFGESITQEQADLIRETLEANGKDKVKFLKWARVDKIENIPADAYKSCIDAAKFRPEAK